MSCHAHLARPLQPLYRVVFVHPQGYARFIVDLRAEDAGSATLLGVARLAQAGEDEHADWVWVGTERVEG